MTFTPRPMTVGIDPHLFVVFGATGDLAHRKLIPALFELLQAREFDDTVEVLGVATTELTDDEFRAMAVESLIAAGYEDAADWCAEFLHYQSVTNGYEALAAKVKMIEHASHLPGNRAFYLAIPPGVFDDVVEGLESSGLLDGGGWTRVVVEKPFGSNLATAEELNQILHRSFDESQIYRIDHYLAKETVQNLIALRFANPLFEASWNRDRIDSIQITVAESIGIGSRAGYYDSAGAVRDIIQNHALQILTLVAMEPPVRLDADSIRDEKVKVLQSMPPISPEETVRGQYGAGAIEGSTVDGYLAEPDIDGDSTTETYAAMTFHVDNWRWRGVPFYVRAGKRMTTRVTEVAIMFNLPPVWLFEQDGGEMSPDVFEVRLQPDEGFRLGFEMKTPGDGYDLETHHLRFDYDEAYGTLTGAYVTLLADVMTGDQTLFVRADEVEEAWRVVEPVLDLGETPDAYAAGSWGPTSADALLDAQGRAWHTPTM